MKEVHTPASVDDARNEGGANPEEAMMTGMEFIHLPRKQFLTPFWLFILCAAPSLRMLARVTRDGTICAKNSTFGYFDETNPVTEKGIQLLSPTPIMAPGFKDSVLMQSQRNFSTLCRTRSKKIFSHFSWTFLSPSTSTIALWHSRVFERSLHGESIQLNLTKAIRHFRNERETGPCFAKTSGIVTGDAPVSYWPIFPATVPGVFARVNSTQFPPRF